MRTAESKNCVLSLGSRHSVEPRNLSPQTQQKAKKCVFGVFLKLTRIALVTSDVKGTGLSGVMAALPFYTKAKTQMKIPLGETCGSTI